MNKASKGLVFLFIAAAFLFSCSQQFEVLIEDYEEVKNPCQSSIKVYENNLAYYKNTIKKQEFAVIPAIAYRLQYTLLQVKDYCPVEFTEDNAQTKYYQLRSQCRESVKALLDLSEENVLINFQEIYDVLEFQKNTCLSYDYDDRELYEILEEYEIQLKQQKTVGGGVGGGVPCAACTVLLQAINDHVTASNISAQNALNNEVTCEAFPVIVKQACNDFFKKIGSNWVQWYNAGQNSDYMCAQLNVCTDPQCSLYGSSSNSFSAQYQQDQLSVEELHQKQLNHEGGLMFIKAVGDLKDLIDKFADQHLPVVDLDNDYFSTFSSFRGYYWRGKDCNDLSANIHPGRKTKYGTKGMDYNCNGISGINDETGTPYETQYCQNSGQLGVILLGDSAGAHFSLPPTWVNGTSWNSSTFDNFWFELSMELDNPQKSAGTGFENQANVNSFYLKLLQRNRCNRNDYQNLGVNGARSGAEINLQKAIARDSQNDYPVIIFWELIGNDVCSSSPTHMTEPSKFKENIITAWNNLDQMLPPGSHMVVTGVADGTVLYDCLQNRTSPTGAKYPVFYNFLNCLEISPCAGWMNIDAQTRQATTERAKELNQQYKDIIAEYKFNNFDVQYYDFPILEIFAIIELQGGKCWDGIEPGDGFHPSQLSEKLWADILWERLSIDKPNWKGNVNPYNEQIIKQFGGENIYVKKTVKYDQNQQVIISIE